MIESMSPLKVVYCSRWLPLMDITNWAVEKKLIIGHDFEYYGRSRDNNRKEQISFGFKDPDIAMLFKLTFGGL